MGLRRIILLLCVMLIVVMTVNGIFVLSNYGREIRHGKIDSNGFSNEARPEYESSMSKNPPVNLLLLGLDEEGVRTDVILLMNYDPVLSRLNLLSIARDTKVFVKGSNLKINALFSKGKEALIVEEIKQLTGLKADYYITMNFKGFRKVIDTLDGVMFKVPFDMDYDDPDQNLHIHLNKGLQRLNGKKAEQLVRYRKGNRQDEGYIDGDIGRIRMQQDFMKELLKQKLSWKYFAKADDIFAIFKDYFHTNIEIRDFTYFFPSIRNIKMGNINSYTLPGESIMDGKAWYFIADRDKTKEIIDNNFYK